MNSEDLNNINNWHQILEAISQNSPHLKELPEYALDLLKKNQNYKEIVLGLLLCILDSNAKISKDKVAIWDKMRELAEYFEENLQKLKQQTVALSQILNTKIIQKNSMDIKDFDYLAFQNRFRGSERIIKEHFKCYLSYFKKVDNVLDIGCGRGEFLELLNEKSIPCYGIDILPIMVQHCQNKGLEVQEADAVTHLREVHDKSLGSIFMAQFVEHQNLPYLNHLLSLCFQKLADQGICLIETINPHHPEAMRWFYLDPTHTYPIYPEFLQWLCQSKGFKVNKIMYNIPTPAVKGELKETTPQDISGDYALIAVKENSR
ncbi:MAG: class I SAM-dependent methyltransferase [bacterium]